MATVVIILIVGLFSGGLAWLQHKIIAHWKKEEDKKKQLALMLNADYQRKVELDRAYHLKVAQHTLHKQLALLGAYDGSNVEVTERGVELIRFVGGGRVTINEAEQLRLPASLPIAPPFATIAHLVAPGRILLGYTTHGPINGDITDLLSTAIVGRPNTGKTTMLRFVVAMLLKIGGIPVLWDPHGSIVDELGDVLSVSESAQDIANSATAIEQELQRRLLARRAGSQLNPPMLLIADEWPVISQIAPDAIQIARRVVLEGRKVNMFALICGQGLPAQLLGGTLVRDALSSRYVFNTTPAQARMAGLDNDTAKELLAQLDTAGPGKAILASATRRPEIVAIPATTAGDIRGLLEEQHRNATGTSSSENVPRNGEERLVDTDEHDVPAFSGNTRATLTPVTSEERKQIIRLALDGIPRREMCTKLGKGKYYYDVIKLVLDEEGL